MSNVYYSVAVDYAEAMLGSMDLTQIMQETNAYMTVMGSDEDPRMYVLYSNVEDRDAGYEALRDRFRNVKRIYSPHILDSDPQNAG